MANQWVPKKYRPSHYLVLRLHARGDSAQEIADATGLSYSHVIKILTTPDAQELLAEIRNRTFDSAVDVQNEFQVMAPAVADQLFTLALSSGDEKVRKAACSDILDRAGHSPQRNVSITHPDRSGTTYDNKSEEQIRQELLNDMGVKTPTVH